MLQDQKSSGSGSQTLWTSGSPDWWRQQWSRERGEGCRAEQEAKKKHEGARARTGTKGQGLEAGLEELWQQYLQQPCGGNQRETSALLLAGLAVHQGAVGRCEGHRVLRRTLWEPLRFCSPCWVSSVIHASAISSVG